MPDAPPVGGGGPSGGSSGGGSSGGSPYKAGWLGPRGDFQRDLPEQWVAWGAGTLAWGASSGLGSPPDATPPLPPEDFGPPKLTGGATSLFGRIIGSESGLPGLGLPGTPGPQMFPPPKVGPPRPPGGGLPPPNVIGDPSVGNQGYSFGGPGYSFGGPAPPKAPPERPFVPPFRVTLPPPPPIDPIYGKPATPGYVAPPNWGSGSTPTYLLPW